MDADNSVSSSRVLLFCGDTFLRTRDGSNPFEEMATLFEHANVCINLETGLLGETHKNKAVPLVVEKSDLKQIIGSIRYINLNNNHVADGCEPARLASILKDAGKVIIGPDNPSSTFTHVGNSEVLLVSAYFPLPKIAVSYRGQRAQKLVQLVARSLAQNTIVNLHWGYEHTEVPAPFQRELAHKLIDAGADLIIGHHPHVPQGVEEYKGRKIYYSLGNFNFWRLDQLPSLQNRTGYIVRYNLITKMSDVLPYKIDDNYKPVLMNAEESNGFQSKLICMSHEIYKLNTRSWYRDIYSKWFKNENTVWLSRIRHTKDTLLICKYIIWLLLPLQVKYYFYLLIGDVLNASSVDEDHR